MFLCSLIATAQSKNGIRELNDPVYFKRGDPDERGYSFII